MDPAASPFPSSDRFIERGTLGAGAFGSVFEAFDRVRQTTVALKVLRTFSPTALLDFKSEFRSLSDVAHPNLVSLYELFADDEHWFFTMELVDGAPLHAYLLEEGDPVARMRPLLPQLADALDALHAAGKLHRDLKPSNVMVKHDGRVVVLDFGLVMQTDEPSISKDGNVSGTPRYMSPEQARGLRLTPATDWFAVGVMLYEVLTGGRAPHEGPSRVVMRMKSRLPAHPTVIAAAAPKDLADLSLALLEPDPSRRGGSAHVRTTIGVDAATTRSRKVSFVGRRQELAALEHALAETAEGAVVVHLHGSSGMGKSALMRQFLDSQVYPRRDAVVLEGRCYEQESVPFKALDSVIDAFARWLGRLPSEQANRLIGSGAVPLAQLFPVMRQMCVVDRPEESDVVDPIERRRRAARSLRRLLARLSGQRIVIAIDDVQWGDVDSAAIIDELLQPPDAPRVLLIAAYRTEDRKRSPFIRALEATRPAGGPGAIDIEVGALDTEDAIRLAKTSGASEDIEAIVRESRGSPFFISTLAAHGARDASDLEAALDRIVGDLPEMARQFLEVVSIAALPLRPETIVRAAAWSHDDPDVTRMLRGKRLIRIDANGGIEAYHDRLRSAVVRRVPADRRRAYHGRLADALLVSSDADAETISVHLAGAGREKLAAEYAITAARQATDALAFSRAARLLQRAFELDSTIDPMLRADLAGALANAGHAKEAAENHLLVAKATSGLATLDHQRRAAEMLMKSGHFERGRDLMREVLRGVGLKYPETYAQTVWSILKNRIRLFFRGTNFVPRDASEVSPQDLLRIDLCWSLAGGLSFIDTYRGLDFQIRHLLLALEAGEPNRLVPGLALESTFLMDESARSVRKTQRLLTKTMLMSEEVGTPEAAGFVHYTLGWIAFNQWRMDAALDLFAKTEKILTEKVRGATLQLNITRLWTMWALLWKGDLREYKRRRELIIRDARERSDRFTETMISLVGFVVLLMDDRPDDAHEEISEAIAGWPHDEGLLLQHFYAIGARCSTLLYQGRSAEACDELLRARPRVRKAGLLRIPQLRVSFETWWARAACMDGRLPEAERTAKWLARRNDVAAKAPAATYLAAVAATRGDRARAIELLAYAEIALARAEEGCVRQAARRARGLLLGPERGAQLVASAEAFLTEREVRDVDHFYQAILPGPWGNIES